MFFIGPDWHLLYGNQDGGPGSYGSVIRVMVGNVKVGIKLTVRMEAIIIRLTVLTFILLRGYI